MFNHGIHGVQDMCNLLLRNGKPFSAGLERLYVELGALESLAHDGKVDLTKIQVEGVIVKVVKDKFPPQPSQK